MNMIGTTFSDFTSWQYNLTFAIMIIVFTFFYTAITINPNQNPFAYDMYVDADYGGLFGSENPRNPDSVRSRTGYIITLGGWPIIWKSVLQNSLSQSTLEAEYVALSSALKIFLPLNER